MAGTYKRSLSVKQSIGNRKSEINTLFCTPVFYIFFAYFIKNPVITTCFSCISGNASYNCNNRESLKRVCHGFTRCKVVCSGLTH